MIHLKMMDIYYFMYMILIHEVPDQLPVGLIAQLVEHCTGIAEVRVQIPGQAFLALISSAKTGMNHTTKNSFQHAFQIKEFHEFTAHK